MLPGRGVLYTKEYKPSRGFWVDLSGRLSLSLLSKSLGKPKLWMPAVGLLVAFFTLLVVYHHGVVEASQIEIQSLRQSRDDALLECASLRSTIVSLRSQLSTQFSELEKAKNSLVSNGRELIRLSQQLNDVETRARDLDAINANIHNINLQLSQSQLFNNNNEKENALIKEQQHLKSVHRNTSSTTRDHLNDVSELRHSPWIEDTINKNHRGDEAVDGRKISTSLSSSQSSSADCRLFCHISRSPFPTATLPSTCTCDTTSTSSIDDDESPSMTLHKFSSTPFSSSTSHNLSSITSPQVRRRHIRNEFLHAWNGYVSYAYGEDELKPVSQRGDGGYHMGLTIIDALDTLIIMGLNEEYERAKLWISEHLHFEKSQQENINVFETTIRVIGGLLSSYSLTGETLFKDKAVDLASRMAFAFDSSTGLPYGTIGLHSHNKYNPSWSGGSSTMAEVASIQLEYAYLTHVTGDKSYERRADHVIEILDGLHIDLYPQFISVETGKTTSTTITLGARVDSLYEYLLKAYIQQRSHHKQLPHKLYINSMKAIINRLVQKSKGEGQYTFIAEMHDERLTGKMDHLVCFVPGMLALGAVYGDLEDVEMRDVHMRIAKELMSTCVAFYTSTPTRLAPEIVQFSMNEHNDFVVDPHAKHNLLRPETVESLFILWRLTKDEIYREWGWSIFVAFVEYCRVPSGGYSGLKDVTKNDIPASIHEAAEDGTKLHWDNWNDKQESFYLAETLKYLYLLFSDDDVIPLDKYVFNTEAHPLPIYTP